jgi:hypothetical protein
LLRWFVPVCADKILSGSGVVLVLSSSSSLSSCSSTRLFSGDQ